MNVVKLTPEHTAQVRDLFRTDKFMGVDTTRGENYFVGDLTPLDEILYSNFCNTYLEDRKNYHAFGIIRDNRVTTTIAFYEGIDDASWYWNQVRTFGDNGAEIKAVLDRVMLYNESKGRLKFYSMFPLKYQKVYRRLAFSENARQRYDYFDEFYVEAKHQCQFTLPWQIMFNRTLVPTDTLVRCTFLKQQYREKLYNAGRL